MTPELLDLAFGGAMLALAVRWLLNLNLALLWTACLGALSATIEPYLGGSVGFVASGSAVPELVMGGGVTVAVLSVAQIIRDWQ